MRAYTAKDYISQRQLRGATGRHQARPRCAPRGGGVHRIFALEEKTIAGAPTLRALRLRTRPELPATRECDQEYIHAARIDYAAWVYQGLVGQDGLQAEGICTTLSYSIPLRPR